MIRLTKISKEFDIYNKRKLVIWGCGVFGKKILDVFNNFNINVVYFCDNNPELWGTKKYDKPIIAPKELERMIIEKKEDITIQIGLSNEYEKEVLEEINNWSNIKIISYQEAWQVLGYAQKLIYLENNNNITLDVEDELFFRTTAFRRMLKKHMYENSNDDQYLLLCLPQKTGDGTLHATFNNSNIKYYNTGHMIHVFDGKLFMRTDKKIKLITAVREPVGQSISFLYQMLSRAYDASDGWLVDICDNSDLWLSEGGDIQKMFNNMIRNHSIKSENKSEDGTYDYLSYNVEMHIENFKHHILDITKYPFDTDLGYSIIKHENIEILIYQLEKMNAIVDVLSEFVGHKIDKLYLDNVASEKWIAESYEVAKKELKITKEQMDFFYNQSYIKHFYSEEDIEKFKARWKDNLV